MEPRNVEPKKTLEPLKKPQKGRFQIVKLEERIAPGKSSRHGHNCISNDTRCRAC
jgi:hypothetical protein